SQRGQRIDEEGDQDRLQPVLVGGQRRNQERGGEQHGDEDAILDDRKDRLISGVRCLKLPGLPLNQRGDSKATTIYSAPLPAPWGAETQAVRGPAVRAERRPSCRRHERREASGEMSEMLHGEVDRRPIIRAR